MKILVTGGAGYIGSFMTKTLLNKGHAVTVVDNLETGHKESVDERADLLIGDLKDSNFINSIFDHSFDAVFHFAGLISMEESTKNPYIYFENNTFAALKLIEASIKNGVNKFIFSSTAGVYGNPTRIPIPEDHQTNPTNPYGESKLMVEKFLIWYKNIFDLSFVSLRYFNAAGASLDSSLGEDHKDETHIIPKAISSILENKEFVLFGTDYKTEDGTCIRDYIHVLDLVDAHVLALNKLKSQKGGFFYNVGTGNGYSNKEVLKTIEKITGKDLKIKIAKRRPGDADILVADSKKIKELGFSPKHSDIETIIETAWKWHSKSR